MALGKKTGGRKKGVPNKINGEAREVFKGVFDALAPEVQGWIRAEADHNPGKAAELVIRMAQHFIPKLNELAGEGGGPLRAVFKIQEERSAPSSAAPSADSRPVMRLSDVSSDQ